MAKKKIQGIHLLLLDNKKQVTG